MMRRKTFFAALGFTILAYAAVLAWFSRNEDRFVFSPDVGKLAPPPDSLHLVVRRVDLRASDSAPLVAWMIPPPPTVPADSAPWLLYCHGNGGNLGSAGYYEAWAMLRKLGIGIFPVDYHGYGESGGKPSEHACYRDAQVAYAWLRDSLKIPPARIIIYGFSLGSAVAVDLAAQVPAAALVVEGALLSVPDVGAAYYPFLPVRLMAHNRFASVEKIGRVACPKLFIHAREDKQVPIAQGRRLFDLAAPPKTFVEVRGGHTTAYKVDPEFCAAIARFLAALRFPIPRPL